MCIASYVLEWMSVFMNGHLWTECVLHVVCMVESMFFMNCYSRVSCIPPARGCRNQWIDWIAWVIHNNKKEKPFSKQEPVSRWIFVLLWGGGNDNKLQWWISGRKTWVSWHAITYPWNWNFQLWKCWFGCCCCCCCCWLLSVHMNSEFELSKNRSMVISQG